MSLILKRKELARVSFAWLALIVPTAAVADERRQGPGDVRDGYDRPDYQTDSASLESRRGSETDLLVVLSEWGPCDAECCRADLNGDGIVGFDDVLTVLAEWGFNCIP